MKITIEAAVYNYIGGRKNNEDNFYLNGTLLKRELMDRGGKVSVNSKEPMQIYAVFDGMGGGEYGEDAAYMGASRLKEYQLKSEHPDNSDYLMNFLTETSKEIDGISLNSGLKSGSCGSTVAILILGDWWFRTAHVGDSRIYLLRGKDFTRITKDQSEVQRLIDTGKIMPEMAFTHPRKNVITHHLGMPLKSKDLESVISVRRSLKVGDWFLICSDGVSDNLRDIEILKLINTEESPEENASRLVKCAFNAASDCGIEADNLTALFVKVCGVNPVDEQNKRVRKLRLDKAILIGLTTVFGCGMLASLMQIIHFFK